MQPLSELQSEVTELKGVERVLCQLANCEAALAVSDSMSNAVISSWSKWKDQSSYSYTGMPSGPWRQRSRRRPVAAAVHSGLGPRWSRSSMIQPMNDQIDFAVAGSGHRPAESTRRFSIFVVELTTDGEVPPPLLSA